MNPTICKYFKICSVAKVTGRNCVDYENCRTYKFYERYPEHLGIGAVVDVSRLESVIEDGNKD